MYVGRAKRGRTGLAGAYRLSGLRGRRGLALGQIDWGGIIQNSISTAGQVAAVAVRPPTYSSVINPTTGAQTITSYGAMPPTSLLGTGTDLTSLLSSPIVLIGGLALLAVFALKR
jgi:hypothetical protein